MRPTREGLSGRSKGLPFEICYRNLLKTRATVLDAQQGKFQQQSSHYYPQGLLTLSLISFLVNFPLLWERGGELTRIKSQAEPMPNKLRLTMLEFAFTGAIKMWKDESKVRKHDMHETFLLSHCALFIWNLEIALFAINRKYPVLSKQTMEVIEAQAIKPFNWRMRVHELFASCLNDELKVSGNLMRELLDEVAVFADRLALGQINLRR